MTANGKQKGKTTVQRKGIKKTDPRRNPEGLTGNASGKNQRRNLDPVTIILFLIALLLLVFLFVFLRRPPNESTGIAEAPNPVIERIEKEDKSVPTEKPVVEIGLPENIETPAKTTPTETTQQEPSGNATARLFFVKVSDEGKIGLKSVLRAVPETGSPLTTAINALIVGPAPGEFSADMISLIPEDATLLGARVDGGIAFLNFNEQFRFNTLGIEGYRAQVEQIVYTATEFPTVEKVQFLVEGQRIDYLGGEGFWVGGPLSREDF